MLKSVYIIILRENCNQFPQILLSFDRTTSLPQILYNGMCLQQITEGNPFPQILLSVNQTNSGICS